MSTATLHTNHGDIVVNLFPNHAPKTVANFVGLAEGTMEFIDPKTRQKTTRPYYDGLTFHRVIDGFMIQGGGFDAQMHQKPTGEPIENEANNGLKNDAYTIAMARTNDPNSATAQFFINVGDNGFLNHTAPSLQGWGYAVFGKVDTEAQQDLAAKFGVQSIPAVYAVVGGEVVDYFVGVLPKEQIRGWLDRLIVAGELVTTQQRHSTRMIQTRRSTDRDSPRLLTQLHDPPTMFSRRSKMQMRILRNRMPKTVVNRACRHFTPVYMSRRQAKWHRCCRCWAPARRRPNRRPSARPRPWA